MPEALITSAKLKTIPETPDIQEDRDEDANHLR
jgi:hypothetical protein